MKNRIGIALLVALLSGCQQNPAVEPTVESTTPVGGHLVGRDSVSTGRYLGIPIEENPAKTYAAIQALQQTKGVTFVNVVSNFVSDLSQLRERLPLYHYILMDESRGTDSGVQITVENDQIKHLYLNSGAKLTQWPAQSTASSSIRVGDAITSVYPKLVKIQANAAYAPKFERVLLLTKNLSTPFDPAMSQSRQWYFIHQLGDGKMDEVQVNFREGKVSQININHYQ